MEVPLGPENYYPKVLLNFFSLGPINDLLSWSGWTPIAKVINTCIAMQFKESFNAMMVMLMVMMMIIMEGLCQRFFLLLFSFYIIDDDEFPINIKL